MQDHPRPKAGVFAVRAGPVVKENMIKYLLGKPLKKHRPQNDFLGLISTGEKYAVASRGRWALEGAYLWTLKDRIDRRWMEGYQIPPRVSGQSCYSSIEFQLELNSVAFASKSLWDKTECFKNMSQS
uniref:Uncharacterized protein n=1 Tax=Trieres chinensis TaxID=1514140 RepID=A0A7S1ZP91_TRICV|mmetsp:Transcript_30171/g.61533  ORF Transcript_30171/g.61533 Transcript_30171/m.61533 type:complete len:127 (+) Transcript_30171:1-381(+)